MLSAEYPAGVDVVYEGVGGALRAAIVPHLAAGGRLLQVGYISGEHIGHGRMLLAASSVRMTHGLHSAGSG